MSAKRKTPEAFEKLVGKLIQRVEAPYIFSVQDDDAPYLLLHFVDGTHASIHAIANPDYQGIFISWGEVGE